MDSLFCRYGDLADVTVKKHLRTVDPPHQSGYAFVYYYDPQSALIASQKFKQVVVDDIRLECSLSFRSQKNLEHQPHGGHGHGHSAHSLLPVGQSAGRPPRMNSFGTLGGSGDPRANGLNLGLGGGYGFEGSNSSSPHAYHTPQSYPSPHFADRGGFYSGPPSGDSRRAGNAGYGSIGGAPLRSFTPGHTPRPHSGVSGGGNGSFMAESFSPMPSQSYLQQTPSMISRLSPTMQQSASSFDGDFDFGLRQHQALSQLPPGHGRGIGAHSSSFSSATETARSSFSGVGEERDSSGSAMTTSWDRQGRSGLLNARQTLLDEAEDPNSFNVDKLASMSLQNTERQVPFSQQQAPTSFPQQYPSTRPRLPSWSTASNNSSGVIEVDALLNQQSSSSDGFTASGESLDAVGKSPVFSMEPSFLFSVADSVLPAPVAPSSSLEVLPPTLGEGDWQGNFNM